MNRIDQFLNRLWTKRTCQHCGPKTQVTVGVTVPSVFLLFILDGFGIWQSAIITEVVGLATIFGLHFALAKLDWQVP